MEEKMRESLNRRGQNSVSHFPLLSFSVPLDRDALTFAFQKCNHSDEDVLCYWQGFSAHREPSNMSLLFIHV